MAKTDRRTRRIDQWSEDAWLQRVRLLREATREPLNHLTTLSERPETMRGRIENFVGSVPVPVGVAGPFVLRGTAAWGRCYVPLATTEGTLVAAVSRGAEALNAGGGAVVHASASEVTRAPLFAFTTNESAREASRWVSQQFETIRTLAGQTSRHGRLKRINPILLGRRLVLEFVFDTGDAAGQNMVTFATDAACSWIRTRGPFKQLEFYTIESNVSLDKKTAAVSFSRPRGRCVNAEVTIPCGSVRQLLGADADAIARVGREGVYSCVVSGAMGAQAQFANVLAALFIATGQDVATVAECGTGLTILETTGAGDLYASVTIPNLIVGTVGGGTQLAVQQECLRLLGCAGSGCATRFAEIAAAAVLAGELSVVASLAADTFVKAHAALGRANGGARKRQTSP